MVSLKHVVKPLVLLCVHSKVLKKHWVYSGVAQKCWKTIGFIACSCKNVEKPLVLLRFHQKALKSHWFYCVFVYKRWKTIGFITFSLKNVEKPLVLSRFRQKTLKSIGFLAFVVQEVFKMNVLSVLASKALIKHVQRHLFVAKTLVFKEASHFQLLKCKKWKKQLFFPMKKILTSKHTI